MVTNKLFTPGKSLAIGLFVGLLAQQASATEEIVVLGTTASIAVTVDQQVVRSEMESYIRSVNRELKSTLDQDLKRVVAPKLELASTETRVTG